MTTITHTYDEINQMAIEWLTHRDLNRAGNILRAMSKLCWYHVNRRSRSANAVGVPLDDLFQEAQKGILHSLTKFDPEESDNFVSYSTYLIRTYIQREIDRAPTVNYGNNQSRRKLAANYNRTMAQLREQHPDATTVELHELLSEQLGVPMANVNAFWNERRGINSLDANIPGMDTITRGDMVTEGNPETATVEAIDLKQLREIVRQFAANRTHREQVVLYSRIASPDAAETLDSIGSQFGVTREYIRQVEAKLTRYLMGEIRQTMGIRQA
jgi:RNA polymerase sigma factor (sigma-70 family)